MSTMAHSRRSTGALAHNVHEWTATYNVRSQESLFSSICAAQTESGQPVEVIAERLGIETSEVESILSGRVELTLTELRLLASACEVVISYDARSASRAYEMFRFSHEYFVGQLHDHDAEVHGFHEPSWDGDDLLSTARRVLAR